MIRYLFAYVPLLIFAIFCLVYASAEGCDGSGAAPNDGIVTVETGTKRKGRNSVPDIEIAHVKWVPEIEKNKDFFENYDLSMLELEFRASENWETYTSSKKTEYNGYYSWNVPRKPCLEYEYRIVVPFKTDSGCFATKVIKLEPANVAMIREAEFTPDAPLDVDVDSEATCANITWSKSVCAEEYEVYIENEQGDKTGQEIGNNVTQPKNSQTVTTSFANLTSCMNYRVDIYPKVKDAELGENYASDSFNTKPDANSALHLKLDDLTCTKNSATLQFYTWMAKVHCLKNFTIETCNDRNECINRRDFADIKNHDGVKYVSTSLQHCTKYFLKVQPTFRGVNIQAKEVAFVTELDDTEERITPFEVDFNPGEHDVSIVVSNVDCMSDYTLNYRLNENNEGSGSGDEWMDKKGKIDDQAITIEDLKPNSSYLVNMTGSLNGKSLSLFELKGFETLPRSKTTTAKIKVQMPLSTGEENRDTLDKVSNQNRNIQPRQDSKTRSSSQGKTSLPEKRSLNGPNNNSALKFVQLDHIVYFTVILVLHSTSNFFL